MEFKISKLQYAYTSDGIASIGIANKEREYFLDEKLTIPLVFCSGEKNVNYWRKKSNISEYDLNRVFGNSESIHHYNKKMEIANSLEFIDMQLDIKYKAHSSKVEYHLKSINKIVDVAFFDKDGNVLVCIEVLYTNKKTEEDISKFNQENIIIYEYDIQSETSYVISAGAFKQEPINRIENGREHIQRVTVECESIGKRISELKVGNATLEGLYKSQSKEHSERGRGLFKRVLSYQRRIRRKENRILKFKEDASSIRSIEEESNRLAERIRAVREEIAQIESNEQ